MSAPSDTVWKELEDATRGQADAAQPRANAWVAANAGSGKTKVLIDRVARLLLQGADPDSILCVTYTKAAASEMQDRLFARLGGWCVMDAGKLRIELAKLEGRDDFDDAFIGKARELFARALETPGGLRIETIHAFCGRVLRRFPLEAGVAPGFQELDDQTSDDLWNDAFRALGALVAHAVQNDQPDLVDAARVVAEAGAGANFGIIRALDSQRAAVQAFIHAHRGADRAAEALRLEIGAGVDAADAIIGQAMGADLPRAALAQAMAAYRAGGKQDNKQADRIESALGDAPAEDRFMTYRGVMFTAEGKLKAAPSIATKGVRAAAPIVATLFETDNPHGAETLRILGVSEAIAARRIYERSAALLRLADIVFAEFALRKNARAGLDFDDLIHGVSRLLTRRYAAEWVLWKLDGGVAHILLDEAQDTSPHQWTILRKLTEDIFAGLGVERENARTFFVVGDQKQSIYSFQGADPERFLREYRDIRGLADLAHIPLNAPHMAMSFRSVQQVLGYVDEVFDPAHFSGEAPFSIEPPVEADYAPHTPFRREEAGSVEFWPLEAPAKAEEPDPWDAPVDQIRQTSPRMKLARDVAAWVRREIDAGTTIWDRGKQRPVQPGDFLILVKGRTGGLFDALLQFLKLQKLPVAGADRIQLLASLPVQDMLNLVRFALCPEDDLTLAEILKGPFGGLDDDALLELAFGRTGSLWKRLRDSDRADATPARAFLTDVLARRHGAPYEFLMRALERPAGLDRPGWEKLLSRFGDPAREPVTALLDRAAAYDASSPPSLELFLAAVEAHGGEVKRELSGPQNQVRVMTVHGAKGLQAPIVILPDTTSAPKLDKSGLFFTNEGAPIWVGKKDGDTPATAVMRAVSDARALREHRRLLYVALTRAQDRLVICGAWTGNSAVGHDKNSWYALCRQGMERLVETGEALEIVEGGARRLRIGAAPPAMTAEAARPDAVALPAWLSADARPETVATRIVAPSNLGGDEPPANPPFGANRAEKLRRGRLIHQLFEALPDIDPRSRRKAGRDFLARQLDAKPADRAEMLEAAMSVIEDERFAAIFAKGGRSEAPVIGPLGDRVVNGRVDRLVVTDAEILIVDYKTDRPAPARVEDVGEAYTAQMAAYRHILSQSWPDRPVRCLLVWTDGPKLMEIPSADLDRALKRVLA